MEITMWIMTKTILILVSSFLAFVMTFKIFNNITKDETVSFIISIIIGMFVAYIMFEYALYITIFGTGGLIVILYLLGGAFILNLFKNVLIKKLT